MIKGIQLFEGASGRLLTPEDPNLANQVLGWDVASQTWMPTTGGGGGGGVTSFNARTGAVVPADGDYAASEVVNDSSVAGARVSNALNTLAAAIIALVTGVSSVYGRTGAVTAQNGDYTASQVTNTSGVTGSTTADALNTLNATISLTGSRVTNGPANTFLAGTASGNQWLTVFTAPTTPTQDGFVTLASSGNFTYLGGSSTGQALIWSGTAWAAGVDFGALTPVTTGGFAANVSTGFFRAGLASGSGSGVASAASAGNLRGARGTNGFQIFVRNNGDTADLSLINTDTVSGPTATFGSTTASGFSPVIAAPSAGTITLRVGSSATQMQLTTSTISMLIPTLNFFSSVTNGTIGYQNDGTNGVTGKKLFMVGQDCGGTTTTGGAFDVRPGSGTTAGGLFRIMSGGGAVTSAQRFAANDTGIGLYATAPVAQATRVGQLTDNSTGAATGAVADVGAAFSQSGLNNIHASILAKLNGIETAIHNIGLTA